jgi:hypothetical protein
VIAERETTKSQEIANDSSSAAPTHRHHIVTVFVRLAVPLFVAPVPFTNRAGVL